MWRKDRYAHFLIIQMFLEDLSFRPKIGDYLEENAPEDCLLEDKLLARYAKILDIVNRESTRSCCFTKAYSHYYIGMVAGWLIV